MNEEEEQSVELDEAGNRLYKIREAAELSGYSLARIEMLVAKGVISKPKPGRLTQSAVDYLVDRKKKDLGKVGRPRKHSRESGKLRERRLSINVGALRLLNQWRLKGGKVYASDNDVLNHAFLHCEACPHFRPGVIEAFWDNQGGKLDIDTTGL